MRERTPWFGLRAQIMLAVSLVFLLSSWLVGFATVQITKHNAAQEHARSQQLLQGALAAEWATLESAEPAAVSGACTALRARVPGIGLALLRKDGSVFACGVPINPSLLQSGKLLPQGSRLTVRSPETGEQGTRRIARLLLFYLVLTGVCVAVFSYVLLTYLIVRPLSRLTASAEQFGQGTLQHQVEARGSAEAVRLARTFNRMAVLLKAEREALTQRLAELERTTRELQRTQRQLIHGEKLASVGRLAAGVAHEIGNPLTAISGLIELLRGGDLSAAQQAEFLQRIAAETDRIHGIIRELLDFARHDGPRAELESRCELRLAIEDAVNLVRPQKESREVQITVNVRPDLGEVTGSRARLTQVVLNLLLNAVDALAGRGHISISADLLADAGTAVLRVSDDGPGIAPEIAQHLFEPFSTTKPAGKGTGLGLAVTHTIVEALGGSISAGNGETAGAWFEVRLPLAPPASARPTGMRAAV
ncbi:MAG TPA: ATP-binding protein [Polyangiales bacterium]|nr:ATP-binding protein [Polyangiales bacterium]